MMLFIDKKHVHWLAIVVVLAISSTGFSQDGRQARSVAGVQELLNALVCLMTCESEGIRGLMMLAKSLKKVQVKSRSGLHVSIVFLGDVPAKMDAVYQQYSKYLPLGELDGVAGNSPDGRSGPGAWGIDRNFPQTIIVARGGKVTNNFVFGRHIPHHDGHVFGAVAEVTGEDRETVADWINDEN